MKLRKNIVLGVVPARGGSKGIKGKNLRPILGKSLVAHAIDCAKQCKAIDFLVVSTDCPEIAKIGSEYGADIPFLRPDELASDTAPMLPVMQHAIIECEKYYETRIDILVLLDPTGPLRVPEDIDNALKILQENDCNAVISGNDAHRNPYFNMVKVDNGYVDLVISDGDSVGRRQDAPVVFDLNTVVWVYKREALIDEKARLPRKTMFYKVPVERSVDIDTEFDFELLEIYLTRLEKNGNDGL